MLGLARGGGPGQLTGELIGQVARVVRPVRPGGHRQALEACRAGIERWVKQDLTVVKIEVLPSGRHTPQGRNPVLTRARIGPRRKGTDLMDSSQAVAVSDSDWLTRRVQGRWTGPGTQ